MTLKIRTLTLLIFSIAFFFTPATWINASPADSPTGKTESTGQSRAATEDSGSMKKPDTAYTISKVKFAQEANHYFLSIHGNSPPTYTMYEMFDPLRVILDIADASLEESVDLPLDMKQGPVSQIQGRVMDDQEPLITRIEIFLANDQEYQVERDGNNIIVKFSSSAVAMQQKEEQTATKPEVKALPEVEAPPSVETKEALAEPAEDHATVINNIEIMPSPGETSVYIKADGPISDYKWAGLPKAAGRPDRMYIDIHGVKAQGLQPIQKIGTALSKIRIARRGDGVRIVFDSGLEKLFEYDITTRPDGLLVTISGSAPVAEADSDQEIKPVPTLKPAAIAKVPQAPTKKIHKPKIAKPKTASPQVKSAPAGIRPVKPVYDAFAEAGFTRQRITVDFFKIDLHNVFRLFGEISGLNIVIAQGVGGTLTLALEDVPWDFALDIILNLKDLEKEEQFNTIVISPKNKGFSWPKPPARALSIQEDKGVKTSSDKITITRQKETPANIIAAKKLIHKAKGMDRKKDFDKALELYEQAFSKWPENVRLANRIGALCLVHLNMNAKAIHYSKAALMLEPDNEDAALKAAIGLANMKKTQEAGKYFEQAIQVARPTSEALISYAAFCEENLKIERALELLGKNEELYGDSMETMVAKARLYDKKGDKQKAVEEYRAVLLSGFEIPGDLKRYIKGRIALAGR
ncbi:MAG: AMIN domain-containing protein [Desulfobulbaceae bacterium]|nr:AMIN domain-containing protein [Desulfobulbaceae bacterium]